MTYTALAVAASLMAIAADLWIFRTRLVTRKAFWAAYAIIVTFQLITNGMFTGFQLVKYEGDFIVGNDSPTDVAPPFIGEGRLVFAPVEDLGFGFALILLSLCCWVAIGRRGIDSEPKAGPPIWRR